MDKELAAQQPADLDEELAGLLPDDTDAVLAAQQPQNIDEAIACMEKTLKHFHATGDGRAIFLRVYYIMTQEVQSAVNRTGVFRNQPVFMDPDWIRRLSGVFASLYFRTLVIKGEDDTAGCRAWRAAHGVARNERSTVLLNALLGINAHINFDLAQAIGRHLTDEEISDPVVLMRRKFDHDQVNNLLVRCMGRIQDTLAKDYEPVLGLGDHLVGKLDEQLSELGLRHYRERVWSDALAYAAARHDPEFLRLVRDKLDWESHNVARDVKGWDFLWYVERALTLPWTWTGRDHWADIRL